jgi:hypothetical protein
MALVSCSPARYGYQAEASDGRVDVATTSQTLAVEVLLDEGYEAASDFTQRATLTSAGDTVTVTRSDFSEPFDIALPPGPFDGEVELLVGFCNVKRKDVCFVDRSTLIVSRLPDRRPDDESTIVQVQYRPEPPE